MSYLYESFIYTENQNNPVLAGVSGELSKIHASMLEHDSFDADDYTNWSNQFYALYHYLRTPQMGHGDYNFYGFSNSDYVIGLSKLVDEMKWLSDEQFPSIPGYHLTPKEDLNLSLTLSRALLVSEIKNNPNIPKLGDNLMTQVVAPYSDFIEFVFRHTLRIDPQNEDSFEIDFRKKLSDNFAGQYDMYPVTAVDLVNMALGGAIIDYYSKDMGERAKMAFKMPEAIRIIAPKLPGILFENKPDYYEACSEALGDSPLASYFPPRSANMETKLLEPSAG